MFEKSKSVTTESIRAAALPDAAWRRLGDDELDAGIAALAEIIGKKEASKPAWARRLGARKDGSGFVLIVEVAGPTLGPWHPDPSGTEPASLPVGYPMPIAIEMLKSPLNPELELADRRKKQAAYNAQQAKQRAADAASLAAKHQERAKLEQEARDWRASDWLMLNGLQRFAARLALAVESRDSKLAADLRGIVAQSLAGDEPEAFPRGHWFAGIGIDSLPQERRQDLVRAAQGEREAQAIEEIPRDKLSALKAMNGTDNRAGIITHWKRILKANKVATPPRSNVAPEKDLGWT